MFDSSNENPELIWNDDIRTNVRNIVADELEHLSALQKQNLQAKWKASQIDDDCAYSRAVGDELVIAGVFIRLFNSNPSWQVRHPKQFAIELIERVLECMIKTSSDDDELSLVTNAFVALLANHPNVADHLPSQGYLPQFCNAMSASHGRASQSALLILSHLTENMYCADSLAKLNCIEGIMKAMKQQPLLVRISAHALKCLLKRSNSDLAAQMLSTGMVHYLLELLADQMDGVENVAATKAEMVDALKSVCLDPVHGAEIAEILNKSSVWAQYKDQRHDLFIPANEKRAISGTPSGVAGYLTERMFNPPSTTFTPPPIASKKFE